MPTNNNDITPLNIKDLLTVPEKYIIPIYQRNYAWEAKEIEQLIQDIIDFSIHHNQKKYYIGTLVVASGNSSEFFYDTIDGQQRLTTLSILSSVIKNEFANEIDLKWYSELNIRFASRKKSMATLQAVFNGEFINIEYEANIKAAYDICISSLKKKVKEFGITINDFVHYLYKNVQIVRVILPDGTDLNHYFEIMNSRGEQLEKHEILKAKLMSCFENSNQREIYEYCFDLIWEGCSNMEKYVQYGFTPTQRHLVFGKDDWNELVVNSFDEFVEKIKLTFENGSNIPDFQIEKISLNIDNLIILPTIESKSKGFVDEQPDRFNSVVNFQNFLLHVLRVQLDDDNVALDDKRLIDIFEKFLPKDQTLKEDFVKEYIYNLLKCKFLFDKYVIKREFTANTDRWSLKCLKWYSSGNTKNGVKYVNTFGDEQNDSFDSDNRKVLMLLSMFHVSIPSMSYKYWLNASLRYVFNQSEVNVDKYTNYLEHIAKSFVFDNYLSHRAQSYYQMINKNINPIKREISQLNLKKIEYGQTENLIFNFCDYLLWLDRKNEDARIKQFEFTFRSSVEHYYPQNPINDAIPKIDSISLHSFGNLCLISHEKNSRLNNHTPKAKQDYYALSKSIDSIKQFLMMQQPSWGIKEIKIHEEEVIKLLEANINSDFKWDIQPTSKARKWFKNYKSQDKQLLIRTLMCFGEIDSAIGWTSGMEKYNLYQWDKIERRTAYRKFEEFVIENSPRSLLEIINYQLSNSQELREDSYRYAFVSRPEILSYCKEGNFGWADNGKRIVLLENSRATEYQSCDLYCFCASKFLKTKYEINSYCGKDRLKISLSETENNKLTISSLNWSAIAFLEIWNNQTGNMCYELYTRDLHGNSKIIRNLKESGWEYKNSNKMFYSSKIYLSKLTEDVEENIKKTERAIENIIKKL